MGVAHPPDFFNFAAASCSARLNLGLMGGGGGGGGGSPAPPIGGGGGASPLFGGGGGGGAPPKDREGGGGPLETARVGGGMFDAFSIVIEDGYNLEVLNEVFDAFAKSDRLSSRSGSVYSS